MAEQLGIQYLYESEADSIPTKSNSLQLPSLKSMSLEWIADIRQAAIEVDADTLMELIDRIPGDRINLANGLRELVNNYCFDEIISLTEMGC